MQALGMAATVDSAGNVLLGLYAGQEDLPALGMGLHTDSVPESGKFDGALGVLGGLACVRTLHSQGVRLRHPILVIDFAAEEATTAASPLGSLSLIGKLTRDLDGPAWDGRSTLALLQDSGFWVERMITNRPPLPMAAFVEVLHIEQGERLAAAGIPVGVVEGIVGIRRYYVTFQGQANHAGTTGMARRRDALVMAAPYITDVQDIAVAHSIVGTVGRVEVHPGAPNVIPGRGRAGCGNSCMDNAILNAAEADLQTRAQALGGQFAAGHRKEPIWADASLRRTIEAACAALGLPHLHLPSGAGHDAMNIISRPTAMIFVPSEEGISHAPDEYTQPGHCIMAGACCWRRCWRWINGYEEPLEPAQAREPARQPWLHPHRGADLYGLGAGSQGLAYLLAGVDAAAGNQSGRQVQRRHLQQRRQHLRKDQWAVQGAADGLHLSAYRAAQNCSGGRLPDHQPNGARFDRRWAPEPPPAPMADSPTAAVACPLGSAQQRRQARCVDVMRRQQLHGRRTPGPASATLFPTWSGDFRPPAPRPGIPIYPTACRIAVPHC